MGSQLHGFAIAIVALAGTATVLGLLRLVLVQVRGVRRLSQQLADPDDHSDQPYEFADCGRPPGWQLPAPSDQPSRWQLPASSQQLPDLPAVRERP